jgi:simple sugar transport system permease protein
MGLPRSITGVFQGLLLFALLACDTLISYRLVWSAPAVLRTTPSKGRRLQPDGVGAAAALEKDTVGQRMAEEKS